MRVWCIYVIHSSVQVSMCTHVAHVGLRVLGSFTIFYTLLPGDRVSHRSRSTSLLAGLPTLETHHVFLDAGVIDAISCA